MTSSDDLSSERLANPKTFADPTAVHAIYTRLRHEAPVARVEAQGYRPFWVVTRYNDIREIERRPEIYQAGPRTLLLPTKVEEIYRRIYGDPNGVKPLTHMDGEYHRLHRGVTMEWFGPKNLKRHEEQIARIAKEFVDRMEDLGGRCDFSEDVAFWFPLRVVMTLLGVPREDEPQLLKLTQRLLSPADQIGKSNSARERSTDAPRDVVAEFAAYFRELSRDRVQNPRDDIISTIANARINGAPMADHEMTSYFVITATAGHDTTAASIGGGLSGFIEFPQELQKLRDDMAFLPTAAEEFVRWTAPVKHFMRTPTTDVELHGTRINAGESIMLCYASGCRDETVIEDPNTFR
ncbi:MAG: cytochrome P450, partial [Sphingomonas oligoaromativorans]